jgi:PRC-barrel domain protein
MAQDAPTSKKALIESDRIEGTAVYDKDARRIGAIKRLMIEKVSGQVVYAVMSFSGTAGVAENVHTIPWGKLKYDTILGGYRTDIAESELHGAPSFAPAEDHDWSSREKEEELHAYYRIPPYWRAL